MGRCVEGSVVLNHNSMTYFEPNGGHKSLHSHHFQAICLHFTRISADRQKGGKEHEVPCHHTLETYLDAYIAAAGIASDPDGPLFRTSGRKTGQVQAMWQQDVYRMIQRRADVAGVKTRIGNHTFRAPASPPIWPYAEIRVTD